MNTRALNSLADLICRAQEQDRTPMGIAFAVDAAGRHMSPEAAAELEQFRALELGDVDDRVSAACGDSNHPTWLRAKTDGRGCPWCRVAELEALKPAAIQTCRACGAGYTYGEPCSTCLFRAQMAAELQARGLEDPHDSPLHHAYRVPHDLPPLGGTS